MGNFHNLSQDCMKGKPQHYLISITFRLMPSEHKNACLGQCLGRHTEPHGGGFNKSYLVTMMPPKGCMVTLSMPLESTFTVLSADEAMASPFFFLLSA